MKSAFVVLLGVVFISMGCNKSNPGVANADDAKEVADRTENDQEGADDYFPGGGGEESEAPASFQDDELDTEDEEEDGEQSEYTEYEDDEQDEDAEEDDDAEDEEEDGEYSPF